MQECMLLNNFNTSYAIIAGLNSSAIQRLKKTWDGLSSSAREKFSSLESLFDLTGGQKNYRKALSIAKPPVVPFLGIHTKDMYTVQENHPDFLEDGSVYFEKFAMFVRTIHELQQHQSKCYSFEPDPILRSFFTNLKALEEDRVYSTSLELEDSAPRIIVPKLSRSLSFPSHFLSISLISFSLSLS